MRRQRGVLARRTLGGLWLALALGSPAGAAAPVPAPLPQLASPAAPGTLPRLVVLVVVDQMRADELDCREGHFQAGLAQLCREGRIYARASLGHGLTETASGHATLATGAAPRLHGVLDKMLWDPGTKRLREICAYAAAETGGGKADVARAADALLLPTLGERLRAARPQARVVALASKARSANLLAGADADLVAWTAAAAAAAQAALPATPQLLGRQGRTPGLPAALTGAWATLPAARGFVPWPAPPGLAVDDAVPAAEIMDCGHGANFPHVLPAGADAGQDYRAWLASPQSDAALVALAQQAQVQLQLGSGQAPDLLLLSLAATDRLGHCFGPAGPERRAILAAVDVALGQLLAALRAAVPEGLVVALTADHGMMPRPAAVAAAGHTTGTLRTAAVRARLDAALAPFADAAPDPVAALRYPFVFLRAPSAAVRARMATAAAAALRQEPAVWRAWSAAELAADPHPLARLMAASHHPTRGGDVVLLLRPYHRPAADAAPTGGSRHGSPYAYDRAVPLLLWGDGVVPGQVRAAVDVRQLDATLAALLQLPATAYAAAQLP